MTDKAEDVIAQLRSIVWISADRKNAQAAIALIASQAAEIERLKKQRRDYLDDATRGKVLVDMQREIASQAAEIERLRIDRRK